MRTFTPAATSRYEADLKLMALIAMRGRPLFEGPLKVCVFAFMAIPASWSKKKQEQARRREIRPTSRPDWDNIAKMLDAFKRVVWTDDTQVVDCIVRKFFSDDPELVVTVEPAPIEIITQQVAA
jgi:Holliday junction resolvase RusA-like endonuclease